MKIESISRKISGFNHDNISATATIDENDNAIEVAKELDILLHKMLNEIETQSKTIYEAKKEKEDTVSLLKRALKVAEEESIPF